MVCHFVAPVLESHDAIGKILTELEGKCRTSYDERIRVLASQLVESRRIVRAREMFTISFFGAGHNLFAV